MEEKYFDTLIRLAEKAARKNEVPISAMIVKDNKVIAKAYNIKNKSKYVMDHAEMLVVKKASRKLKDWRLENCDIYVTLKPCKMCEAIINQSRIKNVYYLLDKPENKKEYYKTKYINTNKSMHTQKYSEILKAFFEKKRDK